MAKDETESPWMTQVKAREFLGLSADQFRKLVQGGLVTTRQLPGVRPAVLRSDIIRISKECVVPARASLPEAENSAAAG